MKARRSSSQFDTIGIVADLKCPEGLELAQTTVRETGDRKLRNLLAVAQALGMRYVVAAGRFNGKGIFGSMGASENDVVVQFQMANVHMDEIGSRTTAWAAKPDSLAALLKFERVTQGAK